MAMQAKRYVSAQSMGKLRILIVDTDEAIRYSLNLFFGSLGHEVFLASSVSEAAGQVMWSRPDVLITDGRFPDGWGLDIVHSIRKSASACIPAIIFSADGAGSPQDIDRLAKCNVVNKRTTSDTLLRLVYNMG